MEYIRFVSGVLLTVIIFSANANQAELFTVTNIESEKSLHLRTKPSIKSKVINDIPSKSNNIIFLDKHVMSDDILWKKVRWNKQEGWVNSKFLEKMQFNNFDNALVLESSDSLGASRKSSLGEKELEEQEAKFDQEFGSVPATELTGATGVLQTNAAQRLHKSKLNCRGRKSEKWKIKLNMRTKRMFIDLEDKSPFTVPITYSEWDRDSRKRMKVIGGSEKKRVKTVLHRSNLCRRSFSRTRYTYSINAHIKRSGVISGCCGDATR